MNTAKTTNSQLLCAALEGAWRAETAHACLTEGELERVAPLLKGSGAAPLGWWRVRGGALGSTPAGEGLRELYRYHTLQAALQERDIERVFRVLEAANVRALLIKGLASARLYPEPGLRPFGDIDVCVRAADFERARRALDAPETEGAWVDLHEAFGDTGRRGFDVQLERAEILRVGEARVRVLAPEDHLRLVCLHMLRHGAWRPLWLCDVGAAFEGRPADFDWTRLTEEDDPKRARWVACAVGLAQKLLGARVEETPYADAARRLPRWLAPEVLKQWETPYSAMQAPMRHRAPMRKYLRRPRGLVRDLINRWPNPIAATVLVGGPFNELPRWPFQLANCLTRAKHFLSATRQATPEKDVVGKDSRSLSAILKV